MMAHRSNRLLVLVLMLTWAAPLQAQTGEVQGRVHEAGTGDPLATVQVTLERGGAIIAGSVTDDDGRYRIDGVARGSYTLFARFIGFQTEQVAVEVGTEVLEVDLRLRAVVLDLDEVEVSAEAFQDESDPNVALTRITQEQVRQLPGGAEDVMRTLQATPGVQAPGDFSNQLIVRGGTPDQNLILLDEIEVYSPYQLSGMGSLLNPALVRQVDLYTGAFPAVYGDRLSSVLAVQTRDGATDRWLGGEVSTNMVSANLILEGKTGFLGGSWLVSGRRTYFDSFANTFAQRVGVFNDIAFPDFTDVQAKLMLRPAPGHFVRFTGLRSDDQLALTGERDTFGEQEDSDNLLEGDNRSNNTALGFSWTYVPSANMQARLLANWYRNEGDSNLGGGLLPQSGALSPRVVDPPPPLFGGQIDTARFAYDQAYGLEKATVAAHILANRGRHTLEAGGGVDVLENRLDLDLALNDYGAFIFDALRVTDPLLGALSDSIEQDKRYHRYQMYVQDRIASPRGEVFLQPSLRYDYYELLGRGYFSPRISASILMGEQTTVRLAGGRYVQSPGFEKLLDPDNLFNLARFSALDSLGVEEALHLGASVTRRIGDVWQVEVNSYWKWLDDLITQQSRVVQRPVAIFQPSGTGGRNGRLDPEAYRILTEDVFELTNDPVNDASGRAYGVEVLVEKRRASLRDPWSGWVSYALARATRTQKVGGQEVEIPFAYDRRHTLSLVVNRRFGQHMDVGVTWRYGSGFPYTPAIGMEPLVAIVEDPTSGPRDILLTDPETNLVRLVPEYGGADNVHAGRLPAYHRLDVRATYSASWQGLGVDLYVDLINIYNRRNTVTYQYYVEVEQPPNDNLPGSLQRPPTATLLREPIYMFPFIPSFGFRLAF